MTHIPAALRRLVRRRASQCCEYCLLPEQDAYKTFEIDHIVAEKHGGTTTEQNLCLSCFDCNRHKGSDLSSLDPETAELVSLFNPRQDVWHEHFQLDGVYIRAITAQGRVTIRVLRLNAPNRLVERAALLSIGHYPCNVDSR